MKQAPRLWSVLLLALLCTPAFGFFGFGTDFLLTWPTPRSTSLGGAMCAVADEADAAYWNPGGLAFQNGTGVVVSKTVLGPEPWKWFGLDGWLDALYSDMMLGYASAGTTMHPFADGPPLNCGVDVTYLTTGMMSWYNERNELYRAFRAWEGEFGLHAGTKLGDRVGVGLNLKLFYSHYVQDWNPWTLGWWPREVGTGMTGALDAGVMYRPLDRVSLGATLANAGPNIHFTDERGSRPLPWTFRLGAAYTPVDNYWLRLRLSIEADKDLVATYRTVLNNPDSTRTFDRKMKEEWRSTSRSVGAELRVTQYVTLRLGYFVDINGQRGGIVLARPGQMPEHYGLNDVLIRRNLGKLTGVGLCWGVGFGYKDHVRLDISDDHAIYDFTTANWKAALTINNIEGLLGEWRR